MLYTIPYTIMNTHVSRTGFTLIELLVVIAIIAILAAILIKTGLDIVDWEFLRELKGKSRVDVITKFIVLILTVFTNLILSVFVGVFFYFILKFLIKYRKIA